MLLTTLISKRGLMAEKAKIEQVEFTPYRPWHHRFLNTVEYALGSLGITRRKRSAESLLAEASRQTGLTDWGDESFREGLNVLLESLRRDAYLNYVGWKRIRKNIINILKVRLKINDEVRQKPEILDEKIVRPLFVVGLSRTGTTMLHRLLSSDPANRFLRLFEALDPVMPLSEEKNEKDPRIERTRKLLQQRRKSVPDSYALHYSDPLSSEECNLLFRNSFLAYFFMNWAPVAHYLAWLDEQDLRPAYRYHQLQLKLLQFRRPQKRWILKAPSHLRSLDALLAVYPDACIVQTHRDPVKAVPSACSFAVRTWSRYTDIIDPVLLGKGCSEDFLSVIEQSMRFREQANPAQFYDVLYRDLTADPVGTVKGIYEYFGLRFDNFFEKRMRNWLEENPRGKHGIHRYSPEQFGLDQNMIKKRFDHYCKYYGIE
jgi:hypothetical protein